MQSGAELIDHDSTAGIKCDTEEIVEGDCLSRSLGLDGDGNLVVIALCIFVVRVDGRPVAMPLNGNVLDARVNSLQEANESFVEPVLHQAVGNVNQHPAHGIGRESGKRHNAAHARRGEPEVGSLEVHAV